MSSKAWQLQVFPVLNPTDLRWGFYFKGHACEGKVQTISLKMDCIFVQDEDLTTVGGRLKKARVDKGLTIKGLANLIGMSQTFIILLISLNYKKL